MSLKANCCPRCLTLNHERGMVHTCTPTPIVRELEARIGGLESTVRVYERVLTHILECSDHEMGDGDGARKWAKEALNPVM